ncbi:MAG: M1 family metallopeptidase, partial [Clostridia bacterium]
VPPGLVVLANSPEEGRELLEDGRVRVRFAETVPMSTYLLAVAIGPFELSPPRAVGQIPVRIAATPGRGRLTEVAQDAAAHALSFLADYFALPCPAVKMDHVALPDFAVGAMENLGCVTYREAALLVDPGASSQAERHAVASTVAHETSHMWFGDLVTMRWWNGAWLNEAFATFIERLVTDHYRPEWEVWHEFQAARERALSVDGLLTTRPVEYPVNSPGEVWGMFDTVTYEKGAAVLRMIEQYLGAETFRDGIRLYLERHQFGNAETHDLWAALQRASGEPVQRLMDAWVFQGGHPVVTARRTGPGTLVLTAARFTYLPHSGGGGWEVPVRLGIHGPDGAVETRRFILGAEPVTVPLPEAVEWVQVNEGASGFFRTLYDANLFDRLLVHFQDLTAVNRVILAQDVWAGCLSGRVSLQPVASILRLSDRQRAPELWVWARSVLDVLDRSAAPDERERLQAFVRRLATPVLHALGWEPSGPEPPRTGRLRAEVIRLLGTVGADPDVRREALRRCRQGDAAMPPDIADAVTLAAACAGGEAEWQTMRDRVVEARTPQAVRRNLQALAAFSDSRLLAASLEFFLSDRIRLQDQPNGIGRVLANSVGAHAAWTAIETHWERVAELYSPFGLTGMLGGLSAVMEDELAARADAWLDTHPVPAIARQLAQIQERGRILRAFRQRHHGRIGERLQL